ncbi:GGDEF domain-containing protein [Gallaecimonas kandeliae]|uniref:GGDEF domain-containing protein n=1 Tax=Gallaecimonas kandeliae TaxID=3029055 RepID=UPI002647BFEF|nr:GGDEF domain-containing protein [Gallaecimonas kandeliae]WKE66149.1 GGDEF domain-containing protein [Gallaecimonas kandeliae]
MANAHLVVDELVDLTALRDQELLDFSLLKTVGKFLTPSGMQLLTLDTKARPLLQIAYRHDKYLLNRDQISLAEEVTTAIERIGMARDGEFTHPCAEGFLVAYALHASRSSRSYLVVEVSEPVSKLNAHLVSGLLQIYRNFCNLLEESQRDPLTGLANRKSFDDRLQRAFSQQPLPDEVPEERRAQPGRELWLAMIDIDNFKAVNDRFGHLYGDEVLLLMAQLMTGLFREGDLVFRFGGEEFVVILRCEGQAACRVCLERFRRAVEERTFPQIGVVTVSIGVARLARDVFPVTLLDYADQALYHSKKSGKNRVTFFDDLLAAGLASVKEVVDGGVTLF